MKTKDLKQIEILLDKKLDQKLKPLKKILEEHSRKLDDLLVDVVDIQEEIKILPDLASKLEKIDRLEERVEIIENHIGIK